MFGTKNKEVLGEQNMEDDGNENEDKLLLCFGDEDGDEDDEEQGNVTNDTETVKINENNNNYKNCETNNLKKKKETETGPNLFKTNKKFKYDSDITIIYEDICDVPADLFSTPPTEEEIEHINSGGAEYNYGNYNFKVAFLTKKSKNIKDNNNKSAKN